VTVNRTPWVLALTGIAATALVAGTALASTPPTSTPSDAPGGSEPGAAAPVDLGELDPTAVRLDARATLSADFLVDDIPTGALSDPANGRTPPYPGHMVPGFSGIVDNDDGSFWAMPDNGFGTIENSTDFLLRLYHVTPDWQTAEGGSGEIAVDDFISLRDPNGVIGFPIVNEDTPERLLTGGDLDIESVQRAPDGTFWIGDEFGPFIAHFDAEGVLLDAPIDPPFGMSPQNPHLGDATPRVERSRGIEAMAMSPDGTKLYPIVEGYFSDDEDQLRRFIYEVDVATGEYTDRSWQLHTETPANMIADAQAIDDHRLLVIERDGFQWVDSAFKRLYVLDLSAPDEEGFVSKHHAVNLLWIANPDGIGDGRPEGGFGLGPVFAFPLESVETVRILDDGRLLVANDNNYPGGNGRVRGTPDDTEMIVLSAVS
jgi:glycerophosphoryl diester phosphodiesterase